MTTNTRKNTTPSDKYCNARKKDGGLCHREAGWGTSHVGWGRCKLHGGSTPASTLFALRLEARARGFGMGDILENVAPHEVLMDLIRSQAGVVHWMKSKVNTLAEQELTYVDTAGRQDSVVWVRMLNEAQDRLERYVVDAMRAGVDERIVRLAEREGRWLVHGFELLLSRLELTPNQAAALPAIMSDVIKELETGDDS